MAGLGCILGFRGGCIWCFLGLRVAAGLVVLGLGVAGLVFSGFWGCWFGCFLGLGFWKLIKLRKKQGGCGEREEEDRRMKKNEEDRRMKKEKNQMNCERERGKNLLF